MEKLKRHELIQIAKDMKLRGYSKLKKEKLIELINNHPSPPSRPPPEVKIERTSLRKEKMEKEKLIELINNSPSPSSPSQPAAVIKEVERKEKMEKLEKRELLQILKDMKIRGCTRLKKARLVELINNPPSPPSSPPPEVIKEMERASLLKLREKAALMGLRGYSRLNKKELVELIKNPPAPQACEVKRKVCLIDESGEKLTFPTIFETAKYFGVNPGLFGIKLRAKSEKARNYGGRYGHYTQIIDGKTYTNLEKNMQT